jgi:hypothetical protein
MSSRFRVALVKLDKPITRVLTTINKESTGLFLIRALILSSRVLESFMVLISAEFRVEVGAVFLLPRFKAAATE